MDFTERSTRVYRTKQLYTKEELAARDGRIVELELSLCSVCPHRRIALAVQLYDGEEGGFSSLKTFELPAHCGPGCRDLRIRGIRFAVPDGACQCSRRALRARVLANYMDTDFNCADE